MPASDNAVFQTTTGTGTGNLTLATVFGFKNFATAFDTGVTTDVFWYMISNPDADEFEIGTGHMSDTTTLVRDTVIENSLGTTALISFTSGTKEVTSDVPYEFQPAGVFTTRGDLIVRGASVPQRLAVGSNGQFLTSNGTDPSWGALPSATTSVAGIQENATAAEMESETASRTVTPDVQHRHPGHPKARGRCLDGGTLGNAYNIASFDDDGTGDFGINWSTGFSSGDYTVTLTAMEPATNAPRIVQIESLAAGAVEIRAFNAAGSATNPDEIHVFAGGDHA